MTEQEILDELKDGPKVIYDAMDLDAYFEMELRGLITMKAIRVGVDRTAVEVRLVEPVAQSKTL